METRRTCPRQPGTFLERNQNDLRRCDHPEIPAVRHKNTDCGVVLQQPLNTVHIPSQTHGPSLTNRANRELAVLSRAYRQHQDAPDVKLTMLVAPVFEGHKHGYLEAKGTVPRPGVDVV
jgi:hypothetical protein